MAEVTELDAKTLQDVYEGVMHPYDIDWSKMLTLRLWDGMDGCWCDCVSGTAEVVLREWYKNTDGGSRKTSFSDIDYYRIFPADTKMVYGPDNELFR